MKKLVIYHKDCKDGFMSAFLFHLSGMECDYMPMNYGDDISDRLLNNILNYEDVYIVDFSWPREIMVELDKNLNLVVLDHHKTAQAACEGLEFCTFDMDKCGATLTFDYLKKLNPDFDEPDILEYIEDRDLWHWKLPFSKEISAAIASYPYDFDAWNSFAFNLDRLQDEGTAIERYRNILIDAHVAKAEPMLIGEVSALGVECTVKDIMSEVAGELATKSIFGVCWLHLDGDKKEYSLRSRGDFDVSEVAKRYGGGGHKNAAGFKQ